MNNSFARLIDGMCATLRNEVLTRLDDDYARGQVFGVINLLNTFKVRADWSADFLRLQIGAQLEALRGVAALLDTIGWPQSNRPPRAAPAADGATTAELIGHRDDGNRALVQTLDWLAEAREELGAGHAAAIDRLLLAAMRAEVDLELKYSPRPLFAEMSSGRE